MRFVPVKNLQAGMILGKDIISSRKSLMLKKGMQLSASQIIKLDEQGYMGAYISDTLSDDIEVQETIPQELFYEAIFAVKEENIDTMVDVATNIVYDITTQNEISINLIDLRSADDYTFHHSVNVAVYAVVVGKKLGLQEKELLHLSQAAICHDLGKLHIPDEILNKPGKLTDEEYDIIKNHPKMGFEILHDNDEISSIVRQAVLMHHENENGSGYPLGKEGSEIPFIAKIIHAVDVYDALTSKRAYKDPYQPIEAFEYLKGGKGVLFDESVVDAILEVIPAFPPGIEVVLSNGEQALVMSNTSNTMRPIIKMIEDQRIIDLSDNDDYRDVVIVKSGIMPLDYVSEIETLNENRSGVQNKKEIILVADENALSRNQMESILEAEYTVISFPSGIELLRYLSKKPDASMVFLSYEMQMIDSITVAERVRKLGLKTIPIAFLASSCTREDVLRCRAVGAIDYIMKPLKPVYIQERVAIALKKKRE